MGGHGVGPEHTAVFVKGSDGNKHLFNLISGADKRASSVRM